MKLTLNDLGKTFEFEYLSRRGELILLKGILTFNEEELRCELDNIELVSHKDKYHKDYFTCLYYNDMKMRNFKEVLLWN